MHRVNLHTLGFRSSSQRASASPSPSPQSTSATGTEKPLVYDPHSRDALVISIRALSCEDWRGHFSLLLLSFSSVLRVLRFLSYTFPCLYTLLSAEGQVISYTSVFLRTWDCFTILPFFFCSSCLKEISSQLALPSFVTCPISLGILTPIPATSSSTFRSSIKQAIAQLNIHSFEYVCKKRTGRSWQEANLTCRKLDR